MPRNVEMGEEELIDLLNGGGLTKQTEAVRARQYGDFCEYVKEKSVDGGDIIGLIEEGGDAGKASIVKMLGEYFFSMRVLSKEGVEVWPKKGYAEKIRCNIKMSFKNHFKFDITDKANFPEADKNWKSFCEKLVKEGRSETQHHPEVDPLTMEAINNLGMAAKEALEARGTDEFDEKLSKVPLELRNKLNSIIQWIAMLQLVLFECRRGGENMDQLKKSDFVIFEDPIKKFKYIKHVKTELDKNHKEGTNSSIYGCIPFLNFNNFNPGEFFSFYLSLLPDESTKEGVMGGYLFPTPRRPSAKCDPHKPETPLFEANQKVGRNKIYEMLPSLTDAVGRPRQTNHSLRATAIMYMRRAGVPWETIIKITGHKSTVNLVKFYDLALEAQGLAEVAVAIGHGSQVAQGEDPIKIQLLKRAEAENNRGHDGAAHGNSGAKLRGVGQEGLAEENNNTSIKRTGCRGEQPEGVGGKMIKLEHDEVGVGRVELGGREQVGHHDGVGVGRVELGGREQAGHRKEDLVGQVKPGYACLGFAPQGPALHGTALHAPALHGPALHAPALHGPAPHGHAAHGGVLHGHAPHGHAVLGNAPLGYAPFGQPSLEQAHAYRVLGHQGPPHLLPAYLGGQLGLVSPSNSAMNTEFAIYQQHTVASSSALNSTLAAAGTMIGNIAKGLLEGAGPMLNNLVAMHKQSESSLEVAMSGSSLEKQQLPRPQ